MKLLKVTVATVISFSTLGGIVPAFAVEENVNHSNVMASSPEKKPEKPIDFGRDKEAAEKWAEDYFEPWRKGLTNDQKKLLGDPIKIYDMNTNMEKFRAAPEKRSEETKRDISLLDEALRESSTKLNADMYVHKNLQNLDVGYNSDYDFYIRDSNEIDKSKYQKLKHGLNFGILNSFMDADLAESSGGRWEPIRLDLKIPKGTSVGHLDEDKIILSRDHGMEVTGTSIITDKGRQVIKVEATLVPKNKIIQKIKTEEKKMNEQFRQLLGIDGDVVRFHLDGFLASSMLDKSKDAIKQLTNNVPNKILVEILEKMNPIERFAFVD
ncbi:hypothetical protein COD21_31455 [Bacillus cereus]|uniref:ADP-ribosyltransferase n=1 Tax=Bacillus cereus TaxID=1396 RepID=UPI000BFB6AD4|nr:ADP-ribosyltransferase [Bacillus cereus]PGT99131.1 hypothetical protein COD21_31455 [Bacillus cereus]